MKLNVAAVLFVFLCSSGTAIALDGIYLNQPAEEVADGECPRLIQIKYPFLACSDGQIGMAEADETWDDSRRIPMMSRWTEGDAWWGPDLNDPNSSER